MFQIEKEQEIVSITAQEFEQLFQVTPLLSLRFAKPQYKDKLIKRCTKALKQGWITKRHVWLGIYYQKELTEQKMPNVVIRWIDDKKGYGLFANEPFKKKQYIGEYTGVLRKRDKRLDETNSYCFEYTIGEGLDTSYTIDAKEEGNHVRFINLSFGFI